MSLYVKTSDLGAVLLTETEKEGVHTHAVDTEESMGNEVGANHNSLIKEDKNHRKLILELH